MDDRWLLQQLAAGPVSGEELAALCGQTRSAVWKRIQALRDAGVGVAAARGRRYALVDPLELLDADRIRSALPVPVALKLASLEVAWSLDSTNSELLRRPHGGGPAALLAERQTGGRGRRGREWASPLAAHLYLSLSRTFEGGLARLGGLSLVAGIAVAEALHALGYGQVRLKWPNDLVVVDDAGVFRKLGGLLIEGGGEHARPARAVIGLGLNVRMPADAAAEIDQPWCDLTGLSDGSPPGRNLLAAAVLARMLPALQQFDASGLAPFLQRYAALDALAGRALHVHLAQQVHTGIALGVAEDGALRLGLDAGGQRDFHAGEVSVRAAGTTP